MFYTYLLQSLKNKKWYTDCTDNLRKRFRLHNTNQVPSTKGRGPLGLIYYEACIDKYDAFAREKYLKSGMGKRYLTNRLKRFLFLTGLVFLLLFVYADGIQAGTISRAPNNLGLVGYWSFNDATSTTRSTLVQDFSGQGNNGVMTNMANPATASSGVADGRLGKALSFDGSDDYVEIGNPSVLNITGTAITVSAWVNRDITTAYTVPLTRRSSVCLQYQLTWVKSNEGIGQDNKVRLDLRLGGGIVSFNSDTVLTGTKVLHYISGVYDGTNVRIYVDGALDGTIAETRSIETCSVNVSIGRDNASPVYTDGLLDEVRIYNRALSGAEVQALYKSGAAKFNPPSNLGLVGYWSFNDATSTTRSTIVTDSSGQGNHGVMTNMANPATVSSGVANGRLGKALNFDGSDDYVDAGDLNALDDASRFTISAWAYFRDLGSQITYDPIVSKTSSGAINDRIIVHLGGTSVGDNTSVGVSVGNGSNSYGYTDVNLIQVGVWGFWTAVYDGTQADNASRLKFYFNGIQQTMTFVGTIPATTANTNYTVKFANDSSSAGRFLNGLIDEVRIYNRALSSSEVQALYKSGAAKFNPPSNLGLVGYWSFNDATSTTRSTIVQDFSGNNNNGVMTNMANPATASSGVANGRLGKALSFDGSDDFVELGDSDLFTFPAGGAGFTVSVWVYKRSSVATSGGIVEKYLSGTGLEWVLSIYAPDSVQTFLVYDATQAAFIARDAPIPSSNTWHHVVGVYDGGTTTASIKIYMDGIRVDNANRTGGAFVTMRNTAKPVGIARSSTFEGTYFNGLIDEVRIYNRALSADEVRSLYNSR